ncbi:hypothetical protein FJZ53_01405 [Candidatus Woesearchaeota archaeon]|nr:hypothetical protein [Candidatus Woesearchaeota archaeon]
MMALECERVTEKEGISVKFYLSGGQGFGCLSSEELEGVVAHELGHYAHMAKGNSTDSIMRQYRWTHMSDVCCNRRLMNRILTRLDKSYKRRVYRLNKWYLLSEIDADNRAAGAGYGKGLLSALKSFLYKCTANKEDTLIRIRSLEEKLGL